MPRDHIGRLQSIPDHEKELITKKGLYKDIWDIREATKKNGKIKDLVLNRWPPTPPGAFNTLNVNL